MITTIDGVVAISTERNIVSTDQIVLPIVALNVVVILATVDKIVAFVTLDRVLSATVVVRDKSANDALVDRSREIDFSMVAKDDVCLLYTSPSPRD